MPAQVTSYKCPSCTGPLHFEASTGRLECEYCGSVFSVEEIEKLYKEKDADASAAAAAAEKKEEEAKKKGDAGATPWIEEGMKAYSCASCGAELICDDNTAATRCPYCDNPTIVPGKLDGALKPDLILPFKVTKEEALAALKKHYSGKPLLPRVFKANNHLEDIQGVYVPFWLFDMQADAKGQYAATISNVTETETEVITLTQHFHVEREGTLEFEKIPADAATRMPDDYMDSIEPYDYSDLKPYSNAYLPGYLADKYDVSEKESRPRGEARARNTTMAALESTVGGYSTIAYEGGETKITTKKSYYALLPVWMLTTRWKNQNYLFAMNGQTGKLVGDLPVDKSLYWKWFGIGFGITAAIMLLITLL